MRRKVIRMDNKLTAGKTRKSECFRLGGRLFYILMLILPLIQFCIFYIGVNFNNIILAFKDYDKITGATTFNNFDNFKRIFEVYASEDILKTSIKNSFVYFGINLIITIPLTLLFAYYITKKFRYSGFFKVMIFLPSIISAMVLVVFYKFWADLASIEFLDKVFQYKEIQEGLLGNKATRFGTVVFFNILISFSSMILIYINAMSQIPVSCLEAAEIDGAGEARKFFSIVIPTIWSTLVSFVLIALAGFATNQANLFSFYGDKAYGNGLATLGYYLFELVYSTTYGGTSMYPYAAALGIFLTLIIAPLTLLARWTLNKFGPRED